MTPGELYSAAIKARAQGSVIGMTLVFPRGFKRPTGFPRGELLSDNEERGRVYSFDPEKIIKWAEGKIKKHRRSDGWAPLIKRIAEQGMKSEAS